MAIDPDSLEAKALASEQRAAEAPYLRTTLSITASVVTASLAFNFWMPFLPLFMRQLGAKSDADAVFWVAVATICQGATRLISGPAWGIISDRFGRKMMLLRALYFGTLTTIIAAGVTAPWQIAIAFGCQGFFSGFIPAAIALVSVSVPDSRLSSSLSLVTGGQYLGNTLGPAIGALLAIVLGYRGAILFAAMLPAIAATSVLLFVPADRVGSGVKTSEGKTKVELEPFSKSVSIQFCLAIFLYFCLYMFTQLLRIVTPIALKQLTDADVKGVVGLTFTLGGLASTISVLFIGTRFFRAGRMRRALFAAAVLTGVAHLFLALSNTVPLYVLGFAAICLLQSSMIPAANTLVASNVSRARRGTAFGVAGSAMAVAFMVGPTIAAVFAAVSLDLGFIVIGSLFIGLGVILAIFLREPRLEPA